MNFFLRQATTVFLLVTIVLLPFSSLKIEVGLFPLYLPEISVALALVAFLVNRQRGDSISANFDRVVLLGVALFIVGCITSFLLNPHSLTGLGMMKSWFAFPFLFAFLLWHEVKKSRERERLLIVWYMTLWGISLRSLYYLLSDTLTYDGRLRGDYSSPNFLAYTLAPAVLIACWYLLRTRVRSWFWFFNFFVLMLTLPIIFATHSYGVWGGIVVALSVLILVKPSQLRYRRTLSLGLLVLTLLLTFIYFEHGSEKWQALTRMSDRSALASRMVIWQSAAKIISDYPIFGIGVGRFQGMYLSYQPFFPPYLEWAVPEPHNVFLAVYLSTGLLGLTGFFILIGRLVFLLWQSYKVRDKIGEDDTSPSLFFGLIALFLVYGVMDTPLFTTELAYVFCLWYSLALPRTSARG